MFILCYELKLKEIDSIIEQLEINDVFNVFYETPLEITKDDNGYGYIEKEDETTVLKVAYDGEFETLKDFNNKIQPIIGSKCFNIYEDNQNYEEFDMPQIEIDDTWILASPDDEIPEGKKKLNFISQGAFGTGLHETTKDLLKIILNTDFTNKDVLDIGTGSGILSIAAGVKNAKDIIAVDIRDVTEEVEFNASLNNLNMIKVIADNVLKENYSLDKKFDWIFINIGGDETEMFLPFIKNHLKTDGTLLVSGLVEWSFDKISNYLDEHGLKIIQKTQTNEWCTATYKFK